MFLIVPDTPPGADFRPLAGNAGTTGASVGILRTERREGGGILKAEVKIQECEEPYAVIYTEEITDEVQRVLSYMRDNADTLVGTADGRSYVISVHEIEKVTVEDDHTVLYTKRGRYLTGRRLYEVRNILGKAFVQISRSVIVRISACESVEADFGGVLLLHLKNGDREYVSRRYVPAFKKSIGL